MSTINDGGPAFPVGSGDMRDPVGMSLRDYFAAAAMQGICASGPMITDDVIALEAYSIADAMIKARTRTK